MVGPDRRARRCLRRLHVHLQPARLVRDAVLRHGDGRRRRSGRDDDVHGLAGSVHAQVVRGDPELNRRPIMPTYDKKLPSAGDMAAFRSAERSDEGRRLLRPDLSASNLDAVTSLMPKDLGLGQVVPFELEVKVTGSTAPENGVITVSPEWLAKTTNGERFRFRAGDVRPDRRVRRYGRRRDGRSAWGTRASRGFNWSRLGFGTNNDRIHGNITIARSGRGRQCHRRVLGGSEELDRQRRQGQRSDGDHVGEHC